MRAFARALLGFFLWAAPPGWRREARDYTGAWLEDAMRAAEDRGGLRPWIELTMTIGRDGTMTWMREWRAALGGQSRPMADLWMDLRFALRSWLRRPGFAVLAIGTLALGVGAVTTSYAIVDGVVLNPLPYPDADRLYRVGQWSPDEPDRVYLMSYPDLMDLTADPGVFESIAGSRVARFNLLEGPIPESILGALVTPGYWQAVGVEPRLGRRITPEEYAASARVVVIRHTLWEGRLGSDPDILGRTISLNGEPFEVVGVMAEGFLPPQVLNQRTAEFWAPLSLVSDEQKADRRGGSYNVLGRLRPGESLESARASLDRFGARMRAAFPELLADRAYGANPLLDETIGNVRTQLVPLAGASILLLLIACTNVANLLMVRATERERELSLRAAIGAGQGRILRQLLTESALLGAAAGVFGAGIAWFSLGLFTRLNPGDIPRIHEVVFEPGGLAFSLVAAIVTSLVFGLAPALAARQAGPAERLRRGGVGSASRRAIRIRGGLIALESGLALMIVMGAGLLVNSYARLSSIEPGFDLGAYTVSVGYAGDDDPVAINAYHQRLQEELEAIPGVAHAGATWMIPLNGGWGWQSLDIRGVPPATGERSRHSFRFQRIRGGYLEAMGIPVLRGRGFDDRVDRYGAPKVAVVNESFAEWIAPHRDPIGAIFDLGERGFSQGEFEIVGVIGDIRQYELSEPPEPEVYFSAPQEPTGLLTWVVKTLPGQGEEIGTALREAVARVTTDVPARNVVPMEARVSQAIEVPRFYMRLLTSLAVVTLILALVGVYGTLAFTFSQSTGEVGIRRALGATENAVSKLLLRRGFVPVAVGIVIGGALVFPTTRVLRSFLYGVAPGDPITLAGAMVILGLTAGIACWIPAWRASRTDPMAVLRGE